MDNGLVVGRFYGFSPLLVGVYLFVRNHCFTSPLQMNDLVFQKLMHKETSLKLSCL